MEVRSICTNKSCVSFCFCIINPKNALGKFNLYLGRKIPVSIWYTLRHWLFPCEVDYKKKFGWIPPKIKEINEDLRSVKVCNSTIW